MSTIEPTIINGGPLQGRPRVPIFDKVGVYQHIFKDHPDHRFQVFNPYKSPSFQLRPYQAPIVQALYNAVERVPGEPRNVGVVIHRRGGKDHMGLRAIAHQMEAYPGSTCIVIAPTIAQVNKIFWKSNNAKTGNTILDDAFPIEYRNTSDKNGLGMSRSGLELYWHNGSICIFTGSDEDKIRGMPCDFAMFSEYQLCDPRMMETVEKMTDATDGVIYINGTPYGENWFYDWYQEAPEQDWKKFRIPITDTIPYSMSQDTWERIQRRHRARGPEGIREMNREYLVSWDAVTTGSIYGDEINYSIAQDFHGPKYQVEEGMGVYTAHDIGQSDAWVTWFFQMFKEDGKYTMRIVDCLAGQGETYEYYANELNKKGYKYIAHFFPHDSNTLTVNSTNRRTLARNFQDMIRLGQVRVLPQKEKGQMTVHDRHTLVRTTFPELRFSDKQEVKDGIRFLRNYRFKDIKDKTTQFVRTAPQPYKDVCMDYADALGYGVRAYQMLKRERRVTMRTPGRPLKIRKRANRPL